VALLASAVVEAGGWQPILDGFTLDPAEMDAGDPNAFYWELIGCEPPSSLSEPKRLGPQRASQVHRTGLVEVTSPAKEGSGCDICVGASGVDDQDDDVLDWFRGNVKKPEDSEVGIIPGSVGQSDREQMPLTSQPMSFGPVCQPTALPGAKPRDEELRRPPVAAPLIPGKAATPVPAPKVAPQPLPGAPAAPSAEEGGGMSFDAALDHLAKLQIVRLVATVSELRAARPLRRGDDEIYSSQFVLQSTTRNFNEWMASEAGKMEFHPYLQGGEDGSFDSLDDGTPVVFQTNGIARTEESIMSRPIRCDRTGSPGHYMETRMLVARLRSADSSRGLRGARQMSTRKALEKNLFYSFTSAWSLLACTAPVGELGEEDSGERIMVRRSIKDFKQHYFHDFAAAQALAQLFDRENEIMIRSFSYDPSQSSCLLPVVYGCYSLRSWQTYEQARKPPEADMAARLVKASQDCDVEELRRLVIDCGADLNSVLHEFGMIGSGGVKGLYTRSSVAYAEERTALIAAVEAGWISVVEAILDFVQERRADLNLLCCEWSPSGQGGDCLRWGYTALDMARIYHREDIEMLLKSAGAKSYKDCGRPKRENPFILRKKQDEGRNDNKGWERQESDDRYSDFSFEVYTDLVIEEDMKLIISGLSREICELDKLCESERNTGYRKLALRWHPDKRPQEEKNLATRVFQWIQRAKHGRGWDRSYSA